MADYPLALNTDGGDPIDPRRDRYGSEYFYVSENGYPDLTEALVSLVREDVRKRTYPEVSRDLCVDESNVWRWLNDRVIPGGFHVNAIVSVYGLRAVVSEMNRLRAIGLGRQGRISPARGGGARGRSRNRSGLAVVPDEG